jgi:hypothetical protein
MRTVFWWRSVEKRCYFEDQGVDEKIILKWFI